jgi:hypothetical protein
MTDASKSVRTKYMSSLGFAIHIPALDRILLSAHDGFDTSSRHKIVHRDVKPNIGTQWDVAVDGLDRLIWNPPRNLLQRKDWKMGSNVLRCPHICRARNIYRYFTIIAGFDIFSSGLLFDNLSFRCSRRTNGCWFSPIWKKPVGLECGYPMNWQ